jgi:hypothetical protein
MMDTQKLEQALEMARCADSNMDNFAKRQPAVTQNNLMFALARAQLRGAIDLLEGGDGDLKL